MFAGIVLPRTGTIQAEPWKPADISLRSIV